MEESRLQLLLEEAVLATFIDVTLGNFAVYHCTARQATLPEQRSSIQITALTGSAIERARAAAALRTAAGNSPGSHILSTDFTKLHIPPARR